MDTGVLGWLIAISLVFVVMAGAIVVHVIEWHLYTTTRAERDALRENLNAMAADRDGWRSVGERALLVAQLGKQVTTRAARVVTDNAKDYPV